MEVKANNHLDAAQRVIVNRPRPRPAQADSDTASFARVAALDQALQATPAVRPEAVARAKELIGDVKYPPGDTVAKIARLFAIKLPADSGPEPQS